METNWAAEHIQTIRTLMERSALYRRALAPIFTFAGSVGIVAAIGGWALKIEAAGPVAFYWMAVAAVVIAGALFLVRQQALKQGENFWSPPTRRVAQAMAPALLTGLVFGCLAVKIYDAPGAMIIPVIWTLLYGLALHAAGFFMSRGIRLFGWAFLIAGLVWLALADKVPASWTYSPHWVMGILFGVSHLAYGIYLYFTEPRKNEA